MPNGTDQRKRYGGVRWGLLVAGLLVLAVAAHAAGIDEYVIHLVDWVGTLSRHQQELVLVGLYVPAAVLWVPALPLTLVSGWQFKLVTGALVAWIGSILGASAAFLIGRFLARGWVARRLAGHHRFMALDRAVASEGFRVTLLVRLLPGFPYTISNYLFSITRVRFRDYLLATALAMLPHVLLHAYIGASAKSIGELVQRLREGGAPPGPVYWIAFGTGLGIILVTIAYLARLARRVLREAHAIELAEARDFDPPTAGEPRSEG